MKEYPKCYAVASIWLKCSDNVTKPGYEDVAALYVTYVLIPQKQITLAGQFLSSCTHLDCDTRDQILRNIKSDSSTVKAHEINTETSQFVTDTSHDTETKEGMIALQPHYSTIFRVHRN